MRKKGWKKIASGILVGALTMAVLTACGGGKEAKTTEIESTDGQTVIRIGWWGNQVRNDGTMEVLKLYEEQNPNIRFEVEFSDWGGYWDKMATQAASDSMPDIIQQDYAYIAQYQAKGQLADLGEFVDSGILNVDDIADSVLQSGNIDGKLWALCAGTNAQSMAYNKEIVEQAGVTIPDQMTWDEFFEISKVIYEKTGVQSYVSGEEQTLNNMVRDLGMELYDFENHKIAADPSVIQKYFDLMYAISNEPWYVGLEVLIEKDPNNVETKPINDGTTWNEFMQSNQVPTVEKNSGKVLEMTMWPKLDMATNQNMYLKPSMFWGISESSANKEEAAKVIDFFTNSKEAQDIFRAERGVPVSSKIAEYIKPALDQEQQKVFDYGAKVEEVATRISPPQPQGFNEFATLIKELVAQVQYKEITPEEATQKLIGEGNVILERAAQ